MPRRNHKREVHRFIVALKFDQPCNAFEALQHAREALRDLHFTDPEFDGPLFRVRSIRMRRRGDESLPRRR